MTVDEKIRIVLGKWWYQEDLEKRTLDSLAIKLNKLFIQANKRRTKND